MRTLWQSQMWYPSWRGEKGRQRQQYQMRRMKSTRMTTSQPQLLVVSTLFLSLSSKAISIIWVIKTPPLLFAGQKVVYFTLYCHSLFPIPPPPNPRKNCFSPSILFATKIWVSIWSVETFLTTKHFLITQDSMVPTTRKINDILTNLFLSVCLSVCNTLTAKVLIDCHEMWYETCKDSKVYL